MAAEQSDLGAVDELLLAGRRLEAIKALCDLTGVTLPGALDAIGERFERLVATRPDYFTVPIEGYWSNFHSC